MLPLHAHSAAEPKVLHGLKQSQKWGKTSGMDPHKDWFELCHNRPLYFSNQLFMTLDEIILQKVMFAWIHVEMISNLATFLIYHWKSFPNIFYKCRGSAWSLRLLVVTLHMIVPARTIQLIHPKHHEDHFYALGPLPLSLPVYSRWETKAQLGWGKQVRILV